MRLNIVYSIGKTASTSVFKTWASEPACLPVVHTHDMRYFCVVDKDNTPFVMNIKSNPHVRVYGEARPDYLRNDVTRYTEFRFVLPSHLHLLDVFPQNIFDSTRMISITRNPVQRRISQFLNDVTLESVNAYIDAEGIDQAHVDSSNVLERLPALYKHVTKHRLLSDMIGIIMSTGNLLDHDKLHPIFRKYFCGCDIGEYTPFLCKLRQMFPGFTNLQQFRRKRLQVERNGSAELMLVAMESLSNNDVIESRVKEFAGIDGHIRRDRVIEQQSTFVAGSIADTKSMLAGETLLVDLYPPGSRELDAVSALGYD